MTSQEFKRAVTDAVQEYIDNFDRFDNNPQLMVNPVSHSVSLLNGSEMLQAIADSDEAVEDAAAARGMESQSASDYQARRNPDFYPVKTLLWPSGNTDIPSETAIDKIVAVYF